MRGQASEASCPRHQGRPPQLVQSQPVVALLKHGAWDSQDGKALGDPPYRGRVKFTQHPGSPCGPRDTQCLFTVISTQHPGQGMLSVGSDPNSTWGLGKCQNLSKTKSVWSD